MKTNLYFARALALTRVRRPRPHIDDYGIFQIILILISPANVCYVRVPQTELCIKIAEYIRELYVS